MSPDLDCYGFVLRHRFDKREPWACWVMRAGDRVCLVTGRDPRDVLASALAWVDAQEPPQPAMLRWKPLTSAPLEDLP